MKNQFWALIAALVFTFSAVGCSQLDDLESGNQDLKERWNSANTPSRFSGIDLKFTLDDLPREGRADREIWPSTYWATAEDSINVRWASGELSPAEKYDRAFNGWEPEEDFMDLKPYRPSSSSCGDFDKEYYEKLGPLANHISRYMGNRAARDGVDNDEDGEVDECDDRDGVETWFGLCHAWVPAAMLEDRPMRTIEHNGVTFHPGDLEALLIAAYNRAGSDFIGARCNDKESGSEIERDEQGRALEVQCRDTNPGTLHVIMTNYLGLNNTAFAEDRTYDYEVWNQPVVSYEVTRMEKISAAKANDKLGRSGGRKWWRFWRRDPDDRIYSFTPKAAFLYDVTATVTYLTESHASKTPANAAHYERSETYTYILELDKERKIVGGEWYGDSLQNHPDFLWNPRKAVQSSVPYLDLESVRELIRKSREPVQEENPEPVETESSDEVTVLEDSVSREIPDGDSDGITVELVAPEDVTGQVSATLEFEHEDLDQVSARLISPAGAEWSLLNLGEAWWDNGSEDAQQFSKTIVLDPQPVGELAGTWRLIIGDHEEDKTGTLKRFSLRFSAQ